MRTSGPIFVVVNACSGSNGVQDKLDVLRAGFDAGSRPYELLVADDGAQVSKMARRAVEQAERTQGVVAVAGGDGTINAVGQIALDREVPFGIIPEGTFNYLSRSEAIPQDPAEAIRTIIHGDVRPVQAGLVNDKVFFVNASVGLYPQLLEDREAYKQRFGRSRVVAVWSALVTLMHQSRQLEIVLEADGQSRRVRTPTLFVGNNRLQLEQVGIAQAPALDKDHLVAIVSSKLGLGSSLKLMLQGFMGRLGDAPEVSSFAFETLSARIGRRDKPARVKVATDGEITLMTTPLTFRPSPHRLRLIVSRVAAV